MKTTDRQMLRKLLDDGAGAIGGVIVDDNDLTVE